MLSHRTFTTAIAACLLAAPLAAQGVADNSALQQNVAAVTAPAVAPSVTVAPATAPVTSMAPTQAAATVGVRAFSTAPGLAPAPVPATGNSPAMMIVGGVALLVGAVIGGDSGTIIMIGGGVLGLFGLWNYLK
ncbi:MAG TPA: hypothetical protein VIK25_10345 [Gemmatimonadaceae bacterium]